MVVLFTQKSANVTLTFYRYPEGFEPRSISADPLLHKRCGSNKVQCDFSNNLANVGTCNSVIAAIGANSKSIIQSGTRSICASLDNAGQCCVSWNTPATFQEGDLTSAAKAVVNSCSNNGQVSRETIDTDLAGTCLVQCLSNRPAGCTG
jgi:hypothetical protein